MEDNNKTADYEISTSEQSNSNIKTVHNEPQEPFLDFMLYASLGIGITGYFVGIVSNGARFLARSRTLRIAYNRIYVTAYENAKKEFEAEESLKAKRLKLKALKAELAAREKIAEDSRRIAQSRAEKLQPKLTPSTMEPALETETIKKTDAFVDVASSSGTRTELVADVASSSGVKTELISGVAPSETAATGIIENVQSEEVKEVFEWMSDAKMEEYLGFISTEQAALNTLFYTRVVMYTCISLMVIASICLVIWFGFKFGWWRSLFG